MRARAKTGPVAIFDPQRLAAGLPAGLRWSPIRGCESPQTAMIRATGLAAGTGLSSGGVDAGGFWEGKTRTALQSLLHAAALDHRNPSELFAWTLSPSAASDAVAILSTHPSAAPGWADALEAMIHSDPRTRDSIWMGVSLALSCLADPRVLDAVTPRPGEHFDPVDFLTNNGTLYLLATGARLNEALQARWEHIDKVNRTWRIPAKNSKSKRVRSVPLNDAALGVLANLGTEGKNEYLFINTKTKEPLTVVNTVWGRIRIAAGLPNLRIHDLRHQHASMLVNSGRSLYEVQQILGHSDPSVTQRYAHLSTRTLQDASNSASEKIAQASKQPPALRVVS